MHRCFAIIWAILAMLAALAFVAVAASRSRPLPTIEIWLGSSLERIEGHPWPRYRADHRLLDISWVAAPAMVAVHLPSGRAITSYSKGTWIGVRTANLTGDSLIPAGAEPKDPVNNVSLLPLPAPVVPADLSQAIRKLERDLKLKQISSSSRDGIDIRKCDDASFQAKPEDRVEIGIRARANGNDACYLILDIWLEE
jgi:hypothetical protein